MGRHEVETAGEAADIAMRLDVVSHKGRRNEKWDPRRADQDIALTPEDKAQNGWHPNFHFGMGHLYTTSHEV